MHKHSIILSGLAACLLMITSCDRDKHKGIKTSAETQEKTETKPISIEVDKAPPTTPPVVATDVPLANPAVPAAAVAPPMPIPGPMPVPLPGPFPFPPFIEEDDGEEIVEDPDCGCECEETCDLGTAGFSTTSPENWYVIDTPVYPNTVPLSRNRNTGSTKGGIKLTSTGVKIKEPGTYWVSFTAVLQNNNDEYTPVIPVFVVRNGVFDPTTASSQLGGVGTLPEPLIVTIQGSGPLQNLSEGDTLSIVATNGGSPEPEPVTVISWSISLYKICDSDDHEHARDE